MIKGNKAKEYIRVEDVLWRTSEGYDIFMYYLGKVHRQMNRPWGKKETKPSWGVYYNLNNKIWVWKDQATEESGNAIHFVERMFSLTFTEALDKVAWDFGLGGKQINASPVKVTWEAPVEEQLEEYSHLTFFTQPFKKQHHEFWNCVDVTEDWCKKFDCYALKAASMNKKHIPISDKEAAFVFICPEESEERGEPVGKLYFPQRSKGNKFRNNVSYYYLWNYSQISDCEQLIVTKSNKDLIVTSQIFPCTISTQAEAVRIFTDRHNKPTQVVEKINTITKNPWIWYGSDFDGVKKCKTITDTNKWKYINTPKNLLPDINDQYLFVKKFGLKKLEEFMKQKKLLK